MTTLTRILLLGFTLALFSPAPAESATFEMRDGREIQGEIMHYFRGIFTVRTRDGKEEFFGQNEVENIRFGKVSTATSAKQETLSKKMSSSTQRNYLQGLSKSDSKFSTPLKTFELWLNSATSGDLNSMVDCYASFRKKEVEKELEKYSKEIREKMRASTAETKFIPGEPYYQGDRATLEVNWQKGVQGDSQVLHFILEGDDWKIIR